MCDSVVDYPFKLASSVDGPRSKFEMLFLESKKFIIRGNPLPNLFRVRVRTVAKKMQFSDFIEAYISPNTPPFASVGSQYSFVNDGEGNVGVDTIFLYDKINAFAEYMSEKIGEKLNISKN